MKNQPDDPLLRDLNRVLRHEFQFSGAFALSTVVPSFPDPGLDVDGVGCIALPLTDHTANLIASIGEQVPHGGSMETIPDTTVGDTIQIDASNIRFMNPNWASAIQEWVEKEVWSGIGCPPFTSPPRCEPHKLLLYKLGGRLLPHQDTGKAPGMFATLVVVLPSKFTGGEVHVSHGGERKVFDNAEVSAFETTIHGWYTDVTYEVKEITSGYRLALSYHLINNSPGIDIPHLPGSDSSLQRLREIFYKWSHDEYPSLEVNKVVVYAFTHLYGGDAPPCEVTMKGQDQRITLIVKQAGDSEGVLVLTGWLDVRANGSMGSDGWEAYDGDEDSPEYGLDTGTRDAPVMSHVDHARIWVGDIQDMQGREARITEINLDGSSILPFRTFSGVRPNESRIYNGDWGEDPSVEFVYRCPALVMFPKKRQLSVMLSSERGEDWAFEELEKSKSEGPSKENREIIEFLAEPGLEVIMDTILEIAIEWDDATVWGSIVKQNPEFFLEQKEYTSLCNGWEVFKLDGVRPTFEMLFQERGGLQTESIKFLLFVKEKLPFGTEPQKDGWISAQATRAMETFAPEGHELTPGVIDIVRWRGLEFASSVILPRFPDDLASFDPLVDFGVSLIGCKEELIALPRAEGQASNSELLDHILDKILATAIPQVSEMADYRRWPRSVSSLLSICIPGNKTKSYEDLLDLISRPSKEPFYIKYLYLYAGIVPDLVKLLGKHGISVPTSPFREFFCYVIGTYLREVLGSKEMSPFLELFKFTCGHEACSRVNEFLRSEYMGIGVYLDVENCIASSLFGERYRILGREYCDWGRGFPPYMNLIKYDKVAAVQSWSTRFADAQELLKTIGTDKEIPQIMGERYQDVVKALEGSQVFVIAETHREEVDEAMAGLFQTCRARWCLCGTSDHGAVHECSTRSRSGVTNTLFPWTQPPFK